MVHGIKQYGRAPKDGTSVLLHYKNTHGVSTVVKARYVKRPTEQYEEDSYEPGKDYGYERGKVDGKLYLREGWYEEVDNCYEFSLIQLDPANEPDMFCTIPPLPDLEKLFMKLANSK